MKQYLKISKEVQEALDKNLPIVALESTIISHGMPYPKNVETARNCEQIIKDHGCVPATIAILNGQLCVGLEDEDLELLATSKDILKASRRDIAHILSSNLHGATTVAATMLIASLAGIKVFATGGIGGVHRGAETTMDISADLEELSETDVIVVCAGAKSILDLGLTLEYLETKGVEVIGYQTKTLPAFYSRESNFEVNFRKDHPKEIADMFSVKEDLNLRGGMLVCNPVPEKYAMPKQVIDQAINQAIKEMDQLGIKGKETTPYLLKKIVEITEGKSLETNIELVYNNCKVASLIAKEL